MVPLGFDAAIKLVFPARAGMNRGHHATPFRASVNCVPRAGGDEPITHPYYTIDPTREVFPARAGMNRTGSMSHVEKVAAVFPARAGMNRRDTERCDSSCISVPRAGGDEPVSGSGTSETAG